MKRLLLYAAYASWNFPINEDNDIIIETRELTFTDSIQNRIDIINKNRPSDNIFLAYIFDTETKESKTILKTR